MADYLSILSAFGGRLRRSWKVFKNSSVFFLFKATQGSNLNLCHPSDQHEHNNDAVSLFQWLYAAHPGLRL